MGMRKQSRIAPEPHEEEQEHPAAYISFLHFHFIPLESAKIKILTIQTTYLIWKYQERI